MAPAIPTTEPTQLRIGDSWAWDRALSEFPASAGWQLSYALRGPSDLVLAWGTEVTANGDGFEVRVPSGTTDNITTAGAYRFYRYVTDGTDRYTTLIDRSFRVLPNPATAVNAKSHNLQMLEALQAAELAQSSNGLASSITVNGRTIAWKDGAEHRSLIAHYAYLVEIERNPNWRPREEIAFT